jgi:hypothetical protein
MLHEIVRVRALQNYRLKIEFRDGVSGTIDLSGELDGEMFESLRDEAFFRQVRVDEFGAIAWPNGADLAPDALYDEITAQSSRERRPQQEAQGQSTPHPLPRR